MSKGDTITIAAVVGGTLFPVEVEATKAGRTVRQRRARKDGGSWVVVEEMTRTHKPVGRSVWVRTDAVISITEQANEVPPPKAPAERAPRAPRRSHLTADEAIAAVDGWAQEARDGALSMPVVEEG